MRPGDAGGAERPGLRRLISVVWLGPGRTRGHRRAVAKDLDRRPRHATFGAVRFEAGGCRRTVSARRVRSFPTLQETARELREDPRGLLGLGAFSGRALWFRDGKLYLEPPRQR